MAANWMKIMTFFDVAYTASPADVKADNFIDVYDVLIFASFTFIV